MEDLGGVVCGVAPLLGFALIHLIANWLDGRAFQQARLDARAAYERAEAAKRPRSMFEKER